MLCVLLETQNMKQTKQGSNRKHTVFGDKRKPRVRLNQVRSISRGSRCQAVERCEVRAAFDHLVLSLKRSAFRPTVIPLGVHSLFRSSGLAIKTISFPLILVVWMDWWFGVPEGEAAISPLEFRVQIPSSQSKPPTSYLLPE